MTRLSSNVKFIRKQLRLTQDQFGQLLGIKRSLVGAYEEGRAEPRLELLQQMATHSGFSVDTIIGTDLDDSTPLSVLPQNHQRGKEVLVV